MQGWGVLQVEAGAGAPTRIYTCDTDRPLMKMWEQARSRHAERHAMVQFWGRWRCSSGIYPIAPWRGEQAGGVGLPGMLCYAVVEVLRLCQGRAGSG